MSIRTGLGGSVILGSLMLVAACSGSSAQGDAGSDHGDPRDGIIGDAGDVVPQNDVDATDSWSPEDGFLDTGIDTGPIESCEALVALWDWRCLDDATCSTWPGTAAAPGSTACLGLLVCDSPPCWDELCQDRVPGICVPTPGTIPCIPEGGCPDGTGCAAATTDMLGTCRPLPFSDACWTDNDCPDGQACAGESVCQGIAPCPGPDVPGRCEARVQPGQCLDNDDCPPSGHCAGSSPCRPGDGSCAATLGQCKPEKPLDCLGDSDCSLPNPICFGAATEKAGTCVPGPASAAGECWDDFACGNGEACHGVFLCPPGTLCTSFGVHAGICARYPPNGHGVELVFPDEPVVLPSLRVVVVNRNAVPIYLNACGTADLEQKRDEAWALTGSLDVLDSCGDSLAPGRIVIPPGGSRLLRPPEAITLKNATRIRLDYAMGCAADTSIESCRVPFQSAVSSEVLPQ